MTEPPTEFERAQREFLARAAELQAQMGDSDPPYCSFCGRGESQVGAMVQGLNGHICDVCAREVQRLLRTGE
jgi:hypothetical protein